MKILVVEDSRASRSFLERTLRHLGMDVISADCGYAGIELFRQQKPDLVLLDVILPDLDGFAVARTLRETENPGDWTPIIFLSALTDDADLEKGIAAGGDDYMHKPVSEVVLCAKVRAMQRIIQMRTSLVVLTRKLDTANQELRRLSSSDGLTGIANRRLFDHTLDLEWRRAKRSNGQIALIMCDVDYFKKFNDTFGHQAGDDCLRQVAQTLQNTLERGGDSVARYGGEEFAIILPNTTLDGARVVADKMRQAVSNLQLPHPLSPHRFVTLSLGVSSSTPSEQDVSQTLIESADRALYAAKNGGRNRVGQSSPQVMTS